MNKLFRLAAYAAVAVGLMACGIPSPKEKVETFADGCQYIVTRAWDNAFVGYTGDIQSVVPRYDSAGKPMCGKP